MFWTLAYSGTGRNLKMEGHNFGREEFRIFFTMPLHFFVMPPRDRAL